MPQPTVKVWYRIEDLDVHEGWTQAIGFPSMASIVGQELYFEDDTWRVKVLIKYTKRSA